MSKKKKREKPTLGETLRKTIVDSEVSHYRIAKDTGISQSVITRFVNEDRSISLDTAGKLMDYFELEIRPRNK